MIFYLNDERFKYELEKLARLFLPFEKLTFTDCENDINPQEDYIKVKYSTMVISELKLDGKLESYGLPLPEEIGRAHV